MTENKKRWKYLAESERKVEDKIANRQILSSNGTSDDGKKFSSSAIENENENAGEK